jgi:hypothetical protein
MSASPPTSKAIRLLSRLATTEQYIRWSTKGAEGKAEWVTVSSALTPELLQAHLDGKVCLGGYPHADGVAWFGLIDLDLHLDDREPTPDEVATVEDYARCKAKELESHGVQCLLVRGHGAGSYHIRFDVAPIAADRLGRWLKQFVEDAGEIQVDTYPAPSGGGNAVRLPGRHHKRPDQWSAAWSGSAWEPWPAALDRLLELPKNPARLFRDPGIPKTERTAASSGARLRPGDIFNLLVPIEDVLRAHGWHSEREDGERRRFTRPGKEDGISASVKDGTVWVFTSSIPELPATSESGIPYTSFGFVAHLVFRGDFRKAARELAKKGFCPSPSEPTPTVGGKRVSDVSDVGRVGPYRPFPVAVLPEVIRGYVSATSSAMNCDPSYSALPALALLGAAIGSTHMIQPKPSWKEPAYVFATTIGFSGTTKSPPFRDIEDIAEDINDRLEQEYLRLLERYESDLEAWTAAKAAKEETGKKPTEPVKHSFRKADTTIQALVVALQDNPRGLLVACDELSLWIAGFTRYSGKSGASDVPNWLQLNNAGTVNVGRKTGDRKEIRVRGVGVSVCGTTQPGILAQAMTAELRSAGLLARCSWHTRIAANESGANAKLIRLCGIGS